MRPHRLYSCRDLVLDLERGCLLRRGQDVKLRPKSFQVLTHLIERHGCLVWREQRERGEAGQKDGWVQERDAGACLILWGVVNVRRRLAE